jgi:predicted nucleotidyltransferase
MRPSESFERNRAAIRALVAKYPAANPRLFGSVLHGRDTEVSDVDILVDSLPGATLFELGGLQMDLQDLLGCRVDLVLPEEISIKYRQSVLAEAVPV